jgi:hypothetical protein
MKKIQKHNCTYHEYPSAGSMHCVSSEIVGSVGSDSDPPSLPVEDDEVSQLHEESQHAPQEEN